MNVSGVHADEVDLNVGMALIEVADRLSNGEHTAGFGTSHVDGPTDVFLLVNVGQGFIGEGKNLPSLVGKILAVSGELNRPVSSFKERRAEFFLQLL